MPECRINLAHIVSYLSEAPKSTRSYEGYNRAEEAAKKDPTLPVPLMVRNAPTSLMKNLGYAHGYAYNPEYAYAQSSSDYCYNILLNTTLILIATRSRMIISLSSSKERFSYGRRAT